MTTWTTFATSGAPAGLDFRVERPAEWLVVPLPEQTNDFTDPLHNEPLAVLMAPFAAVVFAVAARPAFDDGTVAQWLEWVSRQRGLDPGTIEQQQLGPHAGVACWGVQVEDGVVMRARMAALEDGGRLVFVSCMAPEAFWTSVAPTFAHMLGTFTLATPRGARAALAPADAPLAAPTLAPGSAAASTAAPRGPLPLPDAGEVLPAAATAAAVALAGDQATFEPEHELNVRMRDAGAGLVPNVLDYHEQERWATLAPAALRATLRVPFGWHVIDDGRRTLVFDAGGHTQVSLQLLARAGRSDDEILAAKVPELQREWPAMRHVRTAVDGLQCLLVRDASVGGEPIEQAYLLRGAPDDLVLQARVTAAPSHFAAASDLAEVLLRDLQFAGETVG